MQRLEHVTLFFILAVVINMVTWVLANIELTLRLTITGITLLALLWIFWRPFRTIFPRHWQEVLSSFLLLVTLWFISIKFPTFFLPSILIIFVTLATAILLSTKYVSSKHKKHAKTLIFRDDFHDPSPWHLNHWGSNCSSISGNQMLFTGAAGRRGEDGSHRDLTKILEVGQIYEVTCRVKADPGTTGQFRLWCHDKTGRDVKKQADVLTGFKIPRPRGECVSLFYNATHNPDIRIHLQYKPGKGTIFVNNVRIYKIS